MNFRKCLGPTLASLLALGTVSFGSSFEPEAVAANQSWNYKDECGQGGCSIEEADEYYRNGAYGQEVQSEPGPGNREEMKELAADSQSYCAQMIGHMAMKRTHIYDHGTDCVDPRLGW
jgi:hypothetical protein